MRRHEGPRSYGAPPLKSLARQRQIIQRALSTSHKRTAEAVTG
jgi:hypothetical protein